MREMRDVRAVEPLVAAFADVDEDVRFGAGLALWQILSESVANSEPTERDDTTARITGAGAARVAEIDSRTVDALIGRLDDPDAYVRNWAARALGLIGDNRAIEPLIAAMDKYVAEFGSSHPSADQLLEGTDSRVVFIAAAVLGEMTGEDFGKDPAKWREWWEENKDTFLEKAAGTEEPGAAGTPEQ